MGRAADGRGFNEREAAMNVTDLDIPVPGVDLPEALDSLEVAQGLADAAPRGRDHPQPYLRFREPF